MPAFDVEVVYTHAVKAHVTIDAPTAADARRMALAHAETGDLDCEDWSEGAGAYTTRMVTTLPDDGAPGAAPLPEFLVRIARTVIDYVDVPVVAMTEAEAERMALKEVGSGEHFDDAPWDSAPTDFTATATRAPFEPDFEETPHVHPY